MCNFNYFSKQNNKTNTEKTHIPKNLLFRFSPLNAFFLYSYYLTDMKFRIIFQFIS